MSQPTKIAARPVLSTKSPGRPPVAYRLAAGVLLAAGALLYALGQFSPPPFEMPWLLVTLAVLGVTALPAVHRPAAAALDKLRRPSPPVRRRIAVGVGAAVTLYLAASNILLDRGLGPGIHDEHSYLLQTTMLAHGRLWMPSPPVPDFFDSFHILVRPVYGSIYFPGTALLFTPLMMLGLSKAAVALLLTGAAAALAYRVLAEAADGLTALCVAVLLPATFQIYNHCVMIMGNIPVLALGLAMVWTWLRWRQSSGRRRYGWVALLGALAGWAAITRPVDALAFALPVGLAMAWDILRRNAAPAKGRESAVSLALLVAGAAPFLGLQLVFNAGTTGDWKLPPYVLYLRQSQPASVYGGEAAATPPETTIPQKLAYYQEWMVPVIERHAGMSAWSVLRERLAGIPGVSLPNAMLLLTIPAGLLGLLRGGGGGDPNGEGSVAARRVVIGEGFLFLLLYVPNPFFLAHYQIPLTPIVLFLSVLGVRALEGAWPRHRALICTVGTALLALAGFASLPGFYPGAAEALAYGMPLERYVNEQLPLDVRTPAVVLVRFDAQTASVHEEPVYNPYTLEPQDAAIVMAHDLGPRDGEIIRYFGRTQPGRNFYLLDRRSFAAHLVDGQTPFLRPLGTAAELARVAESVEKGGQSAPP